MATLVLQAAGAAIGSLFGPIGTLVGRAVGGLAGYAVDQAVFGTTRTVEGARLADLNVQASREGAAIPRVYGRVRISGQIIWATRFEEEASESREGGKGGGGGTTVTHLFVLRQFRHRALRRADRAHRPRVGRRQAVRSNAATHRLYVGDGEPDAGQPDRGEAGRRRACLSRYGGHRLRAPGAGGLRQPHPAVLVRGDPPGRRHRASDPRRHHHPRRHRVRLRPRTGDAGGRSRQPGGAQPPRRWRRQRLAGGARRAAGDRAAGRARRDWWSRGSATTSAPTPAR